MLTLSKFMIEGARLFVSLLSKPLRVAMIHGSEQKLCFSPLIYMKAKELVYGSCFLIRVILKLHADSEISIL